MPRGCQAVHGQLNSAAQLARSMCNKKHNFTSCRGARRSFPNRLSSATSHKTHMHCGAIGPAASATRRTWRCGHSPGSHEQCWPASRHRDHVALPVQPVLEQDATEGADMFWRRREGRATSSSSSSSTRSWQRSSNVTHDRTTFAARQAANAGTLWRR